MSSEANPRVGTRFGKYEIISLLGRGGMGEVYQARDTEKNRVVAVKILPDQYSKDDEYRRRFTREAHAAAQLQEPHVIPIHDWGEINGSLYIDMRMVRGTDLRRSLDAGPLAPGRAVNIINQVASALDAAHTDGLIHRDIKPENIVVTPDDFAYLLDFGIAEKAGDSRLTQTGLTVGSMAYIAPERLGGERTTAAADIYSLACVLYETLTGHTPFATSNTEQLLTAHMYAPPPRPSAANARIPATFDAVIERGMAKQPDDRYGSAGAFARAAARALAGRTGPVLSPNITMPSPYAAAPTERTYPPIGDRNIAPSANIHYDPPTVAHTGMAAPPTLPQQPYWRGPPPQGPPPQQQTGRGWALPVVLAVCAALLLGVIGVAIVVITGNDSPDQATSSRPSDGASLTDDEESDATTSTRTTTTTTATTRQRVLPPVVRGLDANQQNCDAGVQYSGATGDFSHGGRGTAETTCLFTRNVLTAYWEAGRPSSAPRTVYAAGSVDCRSTGGQCQDDKFIMQCVTNGADDWITCAGGSNARVFIY